MKNQAFFATEGTDKLEVLDFLRITAEIQPQLQCHKGIDGFKLQKTWAYRHEADGGIIVWKGLESNQSLINYILNFLL